MATLVLVRDLMFASKIQATARAIGAPIQMVRDAEKLSLETGEKLIVDLNQPGALEAAASWKAQGGSRRVIGFVSHVDRETIDRARELGIDPVLPRSQFVQQIEELMR
jgi:hypothetical protein